MSSLPILQSLRESILTANVKAVYGEPIAAQGKTVIPVAKIIYGYGGGAGTVESAIPGLVAREAEALGEQERSRWVL